MIPVFVSYFVLTLVLGLWQARRTKSQSDFVLGGKKLPGWMLALSERAGPPGRLTVFPPSPKYAVSRAIGAGVPIGDRIEKRRSDYEKIHCFRARGCSGFGFS